MKYPEERDRSSRVNPPDPFGIEKGAHLVPVARTRKGPLPEPLTTHQAAGRLLGGLARAPVERFVVVPLDQAMRPLGAVIAAQGSVNETGVHPREVFAPAIEARASAILIAHNHPSGRCEPSEPDWAFTGRLMRAAEVVGIPLIDHFIVCKDGAVPMRGTYAGKWDRMAHEAMTWAMREQGAAEGKFPRFQNPPRRRRKAMRRKNPARSERQRRLFGAALGCKRGARCGSAAVRKLSRLPLRVLRDFARKSRPRRGKRRVVRYRRR